MPLSLAQLLVYVYKLDSNKELCCIQTDMFADTLPFFESIKLSRDTSKPDPYHFAAVPGHSPVSP